MDRWSSPPRDVSIGVVTILISKYNKTGVRGSGPLHQNQPTSGGRQPPKLGKKEKEKDLAYYQQKEKKRKKKKEKKGSKKKETHWWDTVLDIGASLVKFLPLILGGKKVQAGSVSVHSGFKDGSIGMATPSAFKPTAEPLISSMGPGRVKVVHSGLLGSLSRAPNGVDAVRGDKLMRVAITPDIEPWLRRVCAYQKYRFRNVAITLQPSVPTTSAGRVLGCFEADVDNPITTGEGEATVNALATSTSSVIVDIWSPHTFVKSFRDDQNEWYYASQSGVEQRTNQQGLFTLVAASDMDADVPDVFADVIVTYEVELDEPILAPAPELGMSANVAGATSMTVALPFGTAPTVEAYHLLNSSVRGGVVPQSLPYYYENSSGSLFRFPVGYYFAAIKLVGDMATASVTVVGSYEGLIPTNFATFVLGPSSGSVNGAVAGIAFRSSGMASGSGIRVVATGNTVTGAMMSVASLGGVVPYINPVIALLDSLKDRLQSLEEKKIVSEVNSDTSKNLCSTSSSSTTPAVKKVTFSPGGGVGYH